MARTASTPKLPRQRVLPVQERSRRKIDAILDATAALLARKGVEAVSMLAIAEEAAVPAATVYHYFESRLAVLAALAERTMVAVDAELQQGMQRLVQDGDFSSRELLLALYKAYREAPGYVAILRALRADPVFEGLVQESNRRGADVIVALLSEKTGLPRARTARVAWMLSEFCEHILQAALMADAREARAMLDELTEMVDVLFLHYLQQS
ncbi:MAG: TetR/AcrR family transcriptional regulator [Pedobacter sp.]|nr:TetR/AcrR family transcriptional regulator [Pedobacter sp.]